MSNTEISMLIDKLIEDGNDLLKFFAWKFMEESQRKELSNYEQISEKFRGRSFSDEYQAWFSKTEIIVKAIIPERFDEFCKQYLPSNNRKQLSVLNYTIQDALCGITHTYPTIIPENALANFQIQVGIVGSIKAILDDRLDQLNTTLQMSLFEDEIDSAKQLLKNKYLRAAGAICGVLLEKHLKVIADAHKISLKKKEPSINDYNQELYNQSVLTSEQFKHIAYLADIRNKCDHNKNEDPTEAEVKELIDGTEKVITYN
jgi:hypothetical protein